MPPLSKDKEAQEQEDAAATVIQAHTRGFLARLDRVGKAMTDMKTNAYKYMVKTSTNQAVAFTEWVVYLNFDFIARRVGKKIRHALVEMDPFIPKSGKDLIGATFDTVWPEIAESLEREFAKRFDKQLLLKNRAARRAEARVDAWPDAPPFDLRRPWIWLRCNMLYAWMPGDLTFFGQLQDPSVWPWLLLALSPSPRNAHRRRKSSRQ